MCVRPIIPAVLVFVSLAGEAAEACTSICLAKNGQLVFGNNLDWYIGDALLVVNKRNVRKRGAWGANPAEWVARYGSITTDLYGSGFTNRGINEAGLVIGEMNLPETVYPSPDYRPSVGQSQWIQYQLDTCATVAEVIASDAVVRIDRNEYPSHFLVCDAAGECAALEWLDGRLRAYSGSALPVKALVNTPYAQCLAAGEDPTRRFGVLTRMLDRYSSEDPVEYVFSMLRTVRHATLTQWSLVFDIGDRRMYYVTARNPAVRSVGLREFDLSCNSPVELLDINGPGAGDVRASFQPFTYSENARMIFSVAQQQAAHGTPLSQAALDRILNYHSTMACLEPPPNLPRVAPPRRGRR